MVLLCQLGLRDIFSWLGRCRFWSRWEQSICRLQSTQRFQLSHLCYQQLEVAAHHNSMCLRFSHNNRHHQNFPIFTSLPLFIQTKRTFYHQDFHRDETQMSCKAILCCRPSTFYSQNCILEIVRCMRIQPGSFRPIIIWKILSYHLDLAMTYNF